jgi:outer membrane beta-barrel protein
MSMLFASVMVATPVAHAADDAAVEADEDYNFSWLDPDKKVYVVQNRKYRKATRASLYVGGGLGLSNPFKSGYLGTVKPGFWVKEWLGLEGVGSFIKNTDSDTLVALRQRSTALPFVREVRSYFGGQATFAPFYAKLNLFNKIIYFDWLFFVGGGVVNTANDLNTVSNAAPNIKTESSFGLFYGTGMNFFLSKHFSVRFDLQGINYGATGAIGENKRFNNFDFTLGAGFFL